MNTKLTLSLSKSVIEKARKYAKKTDTSISQLVENYLKLLVARDEDTSTVAEPKAKYMTELRKLRGIVQLPDDFDYKKELQKAMWEKYNKLK
ncbi:MAG: hypothetical protein JNL63_01235 [Bacteroidia bacterium]|nr:hypothetical protein [Bacteroidia bacterium]